MTLFLRCSKPSRFLTRRSQRLALNNARRRLRSLRLARLRHLLHRQLTPISSSNSSLFDSFEQHHLTNYRTEGILGWFQPKSDIIPDSPAYPSSDHYDPSASEFPLDFKLIPAYNDWYNSDHFTRTELGIFPFAPVAYRRFSAIHSRFDTGKTIDKLGRESVAVFARYSDPRASSTIRIVVRDDAVRETVATYENDHPLSISRDSRSSHPYPGPSNAGAAASSDSAHSESESGRVPDSRSELIFSTPRTSTNYHRGPPSNVSLGVEKPLTRFERVKKTLTKHFTIPDSHTEIQDILNSAEFHATRAVTAPKSIACKVGNIARGLFWELWNDLCSFVETAGTSIATFFRMVGDTIRNIAASYIDQYTWSRIGNKVMEYRKEIFACVLVALNFFIVTCSQDFREKYSSGISLLITTTLLFMKQYGFAAFNVAATFLLRNYVVPSESGKWVFQSPNSSPKEDIKRLFRSGLVCAAILKCETAGLDVTDMSPKNLESVMKRSVLVNRSFQAWEYFADKFADFFDDVIACICKYVCKQPYVSYRQISEVDDWINEIMSLSTLTNQLEVGRDLATSVKVERLYQQYMRLTQTYSNNQKVRRLIGDYGALIVSLYGRVVNKNPYANTMRLEPICLVFQGDSGIGKTELLDLIKYDLLKICGRMVDAKSAETQVYSRNVEQEFFDGYSGQPIIIYDDFAHQAESTANPNMEWSELIRMVNIFPYQLHSAALHEKANNPFRSEFVVITTNYQMDVKSPSIYDQNAVLRRLHFNMKVTIRPEVMTNARLDPAKLLVWRDQQGLGEFDTSHYVFSFNGETFGYDELIVKISEKYQNHKASFDRRQKLAEHAAGAKLPLGAVAVDPQYNPEIPNIEDESEPSNLASNDTDSSASLEWDSSAEHRTESCGEHMLLEDYTLQVKTVQAEIRKAGVKIFMNYTCKPNPKRFAGYAHFEKWASENNYYAYPPPDSVEVPQEDLERLANPPPPVSPQHVAEIVADTSADYTINDGMWERLRWNLARQWQDFKNWCSESTPLNTLRDYVTKFILLVGTCAGLYGIYNSFKQPVCWDHLTLSSKICRVILFSSCGLLSATIAGAIGYVQRHSLFHEKYPIRTCSKCSEAKFKEDAILNVLKEKNIALPDINKCKIPDEKTKYEILSESSPIEKDAEFYFDDPVKGLTDLRIAKSVAEASFSGDHESRKSREVHVVVEALTPSAPLSTMVGDLESNKGDSDKKRSKPMSVEGSISEQASDLTVSLRKNMALLYFQITNEATGYDSGKVYLGQVFIPAGHVALVNRHYIDDLYSHFLKVRSERGDGVVQMWFEKPHVSTRYYADPQTIKDLPILQRSSRDGKTKIDTEFFVYRMPKSFPLCANTLKHFIERSQLSKITSSHRMIMSSCRPKADVYDYWAHREGRFLGSRNVDLTYTSGVKRVMLESGIVELSSLKGDCGAPYVIANDSFPKKLVGIHFGGNGDGNASFSFITMEDISPHLKKVMTDEEPLNYTPNSALSNFPLADKYHCLGTIPDPIYQPTKSAKTHSAIFNQVFISGGRPSKIEHPLKEDGPMLKGVAKYAGDIPVRDENLIAQAVQSLSEVVLSVPIAEHHQRALTFEEGCKGIEGDKAFSQLARSKSAGYPYCKRVKTKGKTTFFGYSDWSFDSPECKELEKRVNDMLDMAAKGIVPEVLFVDTLKDEIRPDAKVDAKKTRVFCASPLDFSIAVRMMFGGYTAHKHTYHTRLGACVGINAKAGAPTFDWTELAKDLTKFKFPGDDLPSNIIAGDFGDFDGNMDFYVQYAILDVVENFYRNSTDQYKRDKKIRASLFRAMIQSKHILHDFVYQLSRGQPSGNSVTVDFNSDYVDILMRYVVGVLIGNCYGFNANVVIRDYGDDHIIAFSPSYVKRFTPRQFAQALTDMGQKYTAEDKTEQGDVYRKLTDVTFLKRSFVLCPITSKWMAPLALASINEMVNWVTTKVARDQATYDNCNDAIMELYFHDKSTFNEYAPRIVDALYSATGKKLPLLQWRHARHAIVTGKLPEAYPDVHHSYV